MASRYGVRPSSLLRNGWEDFLIDYRAFLAYESKLSGELQRARRDKDGLMKTFNIGSL